MDESDDDKEEETEENEDGEEREEEAKRDKAEREVDEGDWKAEAEEGVKIDCEGAPREAESEEETCVDDGKEGRR